MTVVAPLERSICHHLFNSYSEPALEQLLPRLSAMGFEAVELLGEPFDYPDRISEIVAGSGLRVSGLTAASRVSTGRDLVHKDDAVRERTRQHLVECVHFARMLDCDVVGVALTAVGRFRRDEDEAAERARLDEALDWLDDTAGANGVVFAIEVLNRYSSAYLTSPGAGAEITWRRDNLRVTLDTFHLLTEIGSPTELLPWGDVTANVQVSGGARGPVQSSLIDPGIFVSALVEGGYRGPVTLEAFPRGSAPFSDSAVEGVEPVLEIADDFLRWWASWRETWDQQMAVTIE